MKLLALAAAAAAAQAAAFNPVEFFRGRTHGEGMLKIIFQSPKTMTVDSEGFSEKDGSLCSSKSSTNPENRRGRVIGA